MRTISILAIFIFICSLAGGQITFEKVFNKGTNAQGHSVIQTSDNGYVIAAGTGDWDDEKIFLIRTNAAGDTLWIHEFSGTLRLVFDHAILLTGDGGFIICGQSGNMIYLLKTDSGGDSLWSRNVIAGQARAIESTFDGGYIICGDSNGILLVKTDSAGNMQWNRLIQTPPGVITSYWAFSVKQTPDSGYIVSGAEESGYQINSMLLLKTNPNGDSTWMKTYGYINDSQGYSVSVTVDQGYFVCGVMQESGFHAFAIRLNEMGDTLWLRKINESGIQYFYSGQTLPGGGFIVCGGTEGPDNTNEVLLLKFSENGDILWSNTFNWYDKSWGYCVRQTVDNGYIVTGNTTQTTSGITDVYLIKTDSNGFITGIYPPSSKKGLIVYPNPATDRVTFRSGGSLPAGDMPITIYDIFGKPVAEGLLPKGQQEITLEIWNLTAGIYCYGVNQKLQRQNGKLVIVK